MEILNYVLTGLTLASALGAISATFYGVRQTQTIKILKDSNDAYKERNVTLESDRILFEDKIKDLEARIIAVEKLKTPSFEPIIRLINANHLEIMKELGTKK